MTFIKTDISPGAPPLLWSNIDEAFKEINQNFNQLQIYLNDQGVTPINFNNLNTNLSPGTSSQFTLGTIDKNWRSIFTSEYSSVAGNELNGVWLGNAQIKGRGLIINLPEGSTIGGDPETGIDSELIINPDKTFFKTISVNSLTDIVAPTFNSILNINSGNAISVSGDTNSQTITIDNIGVTSLINGVGISVSSSAGDVTIDNTGVTSLGPNNNLPTNLPPGTGISVDSSTGNVIITNTGIISVTGGFGITVSVEEATGIATVSNAAPAQAGFRDFVINNELINVIQADSVTDTFFIDSGYGILLTANSIDDRLTIEWDQRSDIIGSVFADDSTMLVDGLNGRIVGPVFSNVTGDVVGNLTGNVVGDVLGNVVGNVTGDLIGSVFSDSSSMLIDGINGKIVGPLEGNTFLGSLDFNSSTWSGVPGSSSVNISNNVNDFINSGNIDFSYSIGDRSISFNIDFSTPLTSSSKVRIAELQSNIIKGDLLGSVFSDTSSMIINGIDGTIMYYPTELSDWSGTAPTTVGEALDRLAALVKTLNSGTGA
jgi:hypothetical protein